MNIQKLIELEENLLNYIQGEMEVGESTSNSIVDSYRKLLDVVSIRQRLSFPDDSLKSPEVMDASNSSSGDGKWKMISVNGLGVRSWSNGEKIINCGDVQKTCCTSDPFMKVLNEHIPTDFTRHIIRVIDGGGAGELVSQYIITKLPVNAEIP